MNQRRRDDHAHERADGQREHSASERQLLSAFRRHHGPPRRLGALDVGLFVRHGRRPARRPEPTVRHDPWLECVGKQAGRDRPSEEPPPQRGDEFAQSLGQRQTWTLARERTDPLAGHPAIRRDVEDAVETTADADLHRRCEVVEMEELRRRVGLGQTASEPVHQGRGETRAAIRGQRHRRTQHARGATEGGRFATVRPVLRPKRAGGRTRTRRPGAAWRPRSTARGCSPQRRRRARTTRTRHGPRRGHRRSPTSPPRTRWRSRVGPPGCRSRCCRGRRPLRSGSCVPPADSDLRTPGAHGRRRRRASRRARPRNRRTLRRRGGRAGRPLP